MSSALRDAAAKLRFYQSRRVIASMRECFGNVKSVSLDESGGLMRLFNFQNLGKNF
jgi:hypothetical protein